MQFYKSLKILLLSLISFSCVSLPMPPKTSLCMFVNKDDAGKPLKPTEYYFMCINHKQVRYEILVTSDSADKMIATPYLDYLEMNAYLDKMAKVFQKEFLNKIGKK